MVALRTPAYVADGQVADLVRRKLVSLASLLRAPSTYGELPLKHPSVFLSRLVRTVVVAAAVVHGPACLAIEIVVGQVAPRSGPEAKQARAYATGLELAFKQANRTGGVNGNTFALVRKEVDGPPAQLVEETRKLLAHESPVLLAGLCGDVFVDGLVQSGLLEKQGVAVLGYRAVRREPNTPLLFNARAGIQEEVDKIAGHLGVLGIKRWGLLVEEGGNAEALGAMVAAAARRVDAALVSRAAYEAGTTRVVSAVETLVKASPQAILLIGSGPAAARFIEQYRENGGSGQLFIYSGADMEQVAREMSEWRLSFVSTAMQGVVILQVVPNPHKQSPMVAKELHEEARAASIAPAALSYVTMEGFLAGKLIVETARRQGSRAGRAGFAKALEGMGSLNLGGHVVSFKPGSNTGSRYVELTVISGTGRVVE